MFTNTRKMLKKSMICLRKRKNGLFIHSDDSRHGGWGVVLPLLLGGVGFSRVSQF